MTMEIGRERMARMMSLRRLSPATQASYVREMARLVRFAGGLPPARITERQVEDLLIEMRKSGRYADKSVNVAKCAMQFFYEHVTIRPDWTVFKRFRRGKREGQRAVLSVGEVWRVLNGVRTPHNRTALTTIYLCGLRLSEALYLEVGDIHRDEMRIFVHQGKGCRDRFVPMPRRLIDLLSAHYRSHRNPRLIFPALGRGGMGAATATEPMAIQSLQQVFKRTLADVGIQKRNVTIHSLRHSYATHLLDLGVPIQHVQAFLGHRQLATTERYIHLLPDGLKASLEKIEKLAEAGR